MEFRDGTLSICILAYILLIAYCSIQPLAAILYKPIIIIIIISSTGQTALLSRGGPSSPSSVLA